LVSSSRVPCFSPSPPCSHCTLIDRKCPRCRKLRAASKQLVVTRLPQILIVQLKRFTSYDSFSSKVETPIDFPIDSLELGYLLPRKSTSSRYKLNLPHETSTKYQLYALVNHIGGEHTSGHCEYILTPNTVSELSEVASL